MRLFAYGAVPKDGGTYTLYRNLRPGLLKYGWDMRCVVVGAQEHALLNKYFVDEGCVSVAPGKTNLKRQAMAFAEWCDSAGVDVVMPVNSRAMLAALPHLPDRVRLLPRCADITPHGYAKTLTARARAALIIATTPRQASDLTEHYGVDKSKIVLIPHGIDLEPYTAAGTGVSSDNPVLRLAFLGRLEHNQKGVLHIPGIVRQLDAAGVAYHLSIAGTGPHQRSMEAGMKDALRGGRVTFLSSLSRQQVPPFLNKAHVLIVPSHHEGFGFVLIEGMAAGCVPVISRLPGVTDFIVDDGASGVLCDVQNVNCFARAIVALHRDRDKLHTMRQAAREAVRTRFSQQRLVTDYAAALDQVVEAPAMSVQLVPWEQFDVPPPFKPTWRSQVPRPVRLVVRRILFALRLSGKR
ncbi:MAG: glycosyltransferase family 4 protein [Anaerolineae bacterium]|nr:glycosyltransferase family 4 protein [Anaerolineae bacterium]